MNDDERNEVFNTLINILNDQGLGWVVNQVHEQIRLGKTEEREIKTLRESRQGPSLFDPDDYRSQLKPGPLAKFPVAVDYNPKERLQLLIDAIEQSVVHTAQMEEDLITYFETEIPHLSGVEFDSEDDTISPRVISRQTAVLRNEQSKKLKLLLEDLHKEI